MSGLSRLRPGPVLGLGAGVLVSLAPGMLPRGAVLQGLATGLFATAGLALALLCAAVLARLRPTWRVRPLALAPLVPVLAWALWRATAHQDGLRAAIAAPAVSISYWPLAFGVASAVVLAATGAARAARWLHRRVGTPRLAVVAVVAGALVYGAGLPAAGAWLERSDAVLEAGVAQPMSQTRAGGPGSLIAWDSMGVHGRRFAADVSTPSSVRVYAGLSSTPSTGARATLAADELARAGGLARAAVVIAVPTGSGWIDEAAVAGFERRFRGDVATVGIQYARTPSWVGYLFDPAGAADSAKALFDAVSARIAALAPADRPAVYLYGQSLGAMGTNAVLESRGRQGICGAVAVGPPPGARAAAGSVVLANDSDPVARLSPQLLTSPDEAGWLPVVSFLQTTVDVLGALGLPAGSGHVYGEEQALALPTCPPPAERALAQTVAYGGAR